MPNCNLHNSCFPIVPKAAALHLKMPITNGKKALTVLGGLTSFGGAGNNYSMHVRLAITIKSSPVVVANPALQAITEMTRQLRKGKGKNGLILANGGVMSYQHVLCLSTIRRKRGSPYPEKEVLPEFVTDVPVPTVVKHVEGEQEATIEVCCRAAWAFNNTFLLLITYISDVNARDVADHRFYILQTYTVDFKRDNTPQRAYIVGRLKQSGYRFVANHGDEETLREISSSPGEKIGRVGRVKNDGKRNLFVFTKQLSGKL